ncbi:MAG: type II toxin-antitoxin system RelE/ParE family toxin [Chthoniobacteraceae bacterium]
MNDAMTLFALCNASNATLLLKKTQNEFPGVPVSLSTTFARAVPAIVSKYLIFYRPIDDGIELIRVLHGARDITPEYFAEN